MPGRQFCPGIESDDMENVDDAKIRLAAFRWLRDRGAMNGGIYARAELAEGFSFEGKQVRFIGPQGIFKPACLSLPLSITTVAGGPYDDSFGPDGLLKYAYRGTNPDHPDNKGLRGAMQSRVPLIYFHAIRPGRYQAVWPIIIIQDEPSSLRVTAAVDPAYAMLQPDARFDSIEESPLDIRRYLTVQARKRLHQDAFRELVVHAYDCRCAICRLQHPELLDAAHIIPDGEETGLPVIQNGLSLCKIHHAAYDRNILGVSPDYTVKIRGDILEEHDGPMLLHGLQELEGSSIVLPSDARNWPDKERLALRFEGFMSAS